MREAIPSELTILSKRIDKIKAVITKVSTISNNQGVGIGQMLKRGLHTRSERYFGAW